MKLKINNKYYNVEYEVKDYIDSLREDKVQLTAKHASLLKTNRTLIAERNKNNKPVDLIIRLAAENKKLKERLGECKKPESLKGNRTNGKP